MEIYVRAVEKAVATWATVRAIPDYELVVGKLVFKEIFHIAPQALGLYTFAERFEIDDNSSAPEALFGDTGFHTHARAVVGMLESVLYTMAGDDVSGLGSALQSLGARHVSYGVHPAHYSVVETALLRTLEGALGDMWTTEVRKGWAAVLKFVSKGMQAGAGAELEVIKVKRRESVRRQSATLRLKVMRRSEGTSRLARKVGRSSRFHDDSDRPRDDDIKPRLPTRRGDTGPPKAPRRKMHEPASQCDYSSSSSISYAREEDHDLSTSTSTICTEEDERMVNILLLAGMSVTT
mmetsp:Transcript_56731/g.159250  ORF Transcript_56731/g.159250 Transcript_56731/m.159250 type:complete len:293 (-) Transcript_56731:804-1682(-)